MTIFEILVHAALYLDALRKLVDEGFDLGEARDTSARALHEAVNTLIAVALTLDSADEAAAMIREVLDDD